MHNFGHRPTLTIALRWVSLAVILFAALVFVAGQVVGLSGLDEALRKLSASTIVTVLLAVLAANVLRFYRWPYFAKCLDINVPTPKLALYYVAGMALLPTPGKLGTALRLWLLNKHHGVAYKKSAPMLVFDFLTDALAVVLMVAIALPWFGHEAGIRLGLFIVVLLLVGLVAVLYYPAVPQALLKMAERGLGAKPGWLESVSQLLEDLRTLVGPRPLLITTGLALAAWMLVTTAFAAVLMDLGYVGGTWPLAAFALGGSMVLGAASLLPGGLGSTEATLMAILLASGLPLAEATLFTALVRVCTLWLPVAAGLAALPLALKKR